MNKTIRIILAVVASALFSTLAIQLSWNWHIANLGLPHLGFFQAAGIRIAAGLATGNFGVLWKLTEGETPYDEFMADSILRNLTLGLLIVISYLLMEMS